ncbi:MAG: hypothetical protein NT027_16965 [Proteobacteria bacterium]|nr:hypothetical protein [Pseudomonadota bacterium]
MKKYIPAFLLGMGFLPLMGYLLKMIPVQHSVPCAVKVSNQSGIGLKAVPLTISKITATKANVSIESGAEKSVLLAEGECEGLGEFPNGPTFGVALYREDLNSIYHVEVISSELIGKGRPLVVGVK